MNTNHECKNKQLSGTLSVFFEKNVNLAHIKLISLFRMALCKVRTLWRNSFSICCRGIGEFVHRNLKPIRILPHGRKAKSIFCYGLDILTEFLVRGRNDHQLQFSDFLKINEKQLNVTGLKNVIY